MRMTFYALMALIAAGLAGCGILVAASLFPEPGSNMVLMGLPLVAAPVSCLGTALMGLAWSAGAKLSPNERRVAYTVGACTALPFALLFALG